MTTRVDLIEVSLDKLILVLTPNVVRSLRLLFQDPIRLPLQVVFCVCAFGAAVTNDHNFVSFAVLNGVDRDNAPWIQSVAASVDIVVILLFTNFVCLKNSF